MIIQKIKPGCEDTLRDLLHDIGHDIRGNPHVRFPDSPNTHFARYVIIPGDMPAGSDLEPHLVFSSNFDGDFDTYAQELVRITPALDDIWSCVQGYTGPATFGDFLRRYHQPPDTYYIAFRNESVRSIKNYIALRQVIEELLDDPKLRNLINMIMSLPESPPSLLARVRSTVQPAVEGALLRVLQATLGPIVENHLFPDAEFQDPYSPIRSQIANRAPERRELRNHVQNLAGFEDLVVQNQMNILSQVRPEHLDRLKRTLGFVSTAAMLSPPGNLAGISTIHFARWIVFDGGRHMLFMSNYDGSWENYIADFVQLVSGGMNSIWRNTVGFTEGGPKDIFAFEEHIRTHQIRSLVFYSAYPDQTVLNILDDQRLAETLRKRLHQPDIIETLRRL